MPNLATNTQGSLLGKQLFEALTEQEVTRLLEALLAVMPLDLQDKVLDQLQPDTRQTVQQILAVPPASRDPGVSQDTPVSIAKLAQTWASLWQEWDGVVLEAAQEEGDYITQEAHWEPPYFDETAFIEDLEQIAKKMRPLIQAAVQHSFSPDSGFAEALAVAEDDVSAALPEWIYLEGFHLEENLTFCLLEWEWLQFKEAEQDAFAFAQLILDVKDSFSHISLDSSAFLDFLTQLPETDRQDIFNGLTQHQETAPWKDLLSTPYSPWYAFYLDCIEQYAPERYLDTLRATIPQQWQNGLPVIEDLLAKKEYQQSLPVIRDTLQALLKSERVDEAWTPVTSLLAVAVPQYPGDTARLENHQKLLNYYQQAAQGLDQTDLVNVLKLQLIAFEHCFNWETMLKAFTEVPVSPQARQALFESWRGYIIQRTRPQTWGYGWTQSPDTWWLPWLIDSLSDQQKGSAWFQQEMTQWLAQLPGDRRSLGEDYHFLRLLTKDLTEISGRYLEQYPQFYQVVIRPGELSTSDQASRQAYLKQAAPQDLMEQVMAYWQAHLQNLVPRPEEAQKSDYTAHAQWLAALRELSPLSYEALLKKWRVEHHRRRNLWTALARLGLS